MLLSDVFLSVTYIGPKSRTERPRKTKIGTEVAHASHMTWTPLSKSKGQRSRSPGCFTHRGLNAWGRCSSDRENVLGFWNYCYVASARRRARHWGVHGGRARAYRVTTRTGGCCWCYLLLAVCHALAGIQSRRWTM